jgi:hypothetical protein
VYFWVDDEPVFRYVRSGSTLIERTFFYNDHLRTPQVAVAVDDTMANPTVTYRASREPFMAGAPEYEAAGSVPVRLRSPGQWADDGTAMWGTYSTLLDSGMTDLRTFSWSRSGHDERFESDPA